jgi:hypothetical protein
MRTNITKSKSGHYTVTLRSIRYPDLKVTEEKLPNLELARWHAREGGKLRTALKSKVDARDYANLAPLPDYDFSQDKKD